MFWLSVPFLLASVLAACGGSGPAVPGDAPAAPATLDEFRALAGRIVADAGVPGAAIALVRPEGIEWTGGIGVADRERAIAVTPDTHFRVGSISKTFIAVALVQQYLDDAIDLDAAVADVASDVVIDNPYGTPVTVLQLLQHTAGFDDTHFNEMYNLEDPPDLPLVEVLRRNPASRRVRWRPGTRMSYSNPGYAVAAHVLERVTGRRYEDVVGDRIFTPLGMTTSSFSLAESDLPLLARGYDRRSGPPVPFTQMYLRPAGNLHTSARELGGFVQMLLNWGETADELVVDPEYLSNMERPRTSLSARAGLIYGYGSGIVSRTLAGFPVLGHDGGVDGFASAYGYSVARDAGWVVLVNATYAPTVVERLSALALRYLKRDVEPPPKPIHVAPPGALAALSGYYHPASARNQVLAGLEWLLGGSSLRVEGNALVATPVFGPAERLVPVSDTLFRRDADVTPSRVFAIDEDDRTVLLGDGYYGVRTPRWRVEIVRSAIIGSIAAIATLPFAAIWWLVRVRRAPGFRTLKLTLGLLPLAVAACCVLGLAPARDWGVLNLWTRVTFVGSWAVPLLSIVSVALLGTGWRRDPAGRAFLAYAAITTLAGLVLSGYMAAWGWIGLRPWAY